MAPLAAVSVITRGWPGGRASRPVSPGSAGSPARRKVRPPLLEVKTFLKLEPGSGKPRLEHASATSDADAAATADASTASDGQLNDSFDQCRPLSVDLHSFGAMPAHTEWPDTVSAAAGVTLLTSVHVPLPTSLRYSRAALRLPSTGSAAAKATPSDAASATIARPAAPGSDTRCQRWPPSVVAHRPGPNSQPSLAFSNRTVLTADSGGPLNDGTSETAGAGTLAQVFPPLTVFSSRAGQGSSPQWRAPSTNPVRADTKLAESASKPFGGGGLPPAGWAAAVPAPSARSSTGRAASAMARATDSFMVESLFPCGGTTYGARHTTSLL